MKGIDNKWHLTLFIENGRILDYPGRPLKTGLLEIAKIHKGDFRLTANQNLIIAGVPESQKAKIEKPGARSWLDGCGEAAARKLDGLRVVPDLPAGDGGSRTFPAVVRQQSGSDHGKTRRRRRAHSVMRVTGCPNGCGRAMLAELGLVGKAPGRYNLHLGGNRIGTRIPRMFRENITEPEILDSIDELVGRWAKEREAGEGFGDFTVRAGIIRPVLDPARDFWE